MKVLDVLLPEPGSIYVLDRGYVDFQRLWRIHEARAVFVTRAKKNLSWRRRYSAPVDRTTGIICDQTIMLTGRDTPEYYPAALRRIHYRDPESGEKLVFLTNDFTVPALDIARLYRSRWRIELFFKWIKQHLRIKAFYGTSDNPVKTQVWIAIATYVLVAIVRKRLEIERDLYTMLQILSVYVFEKAPLAQLLSAPAYTRENRTFSNQLSFFEL